MNGVDTYYFGKACECWDDRMIDNRWTERSTQRNQAGQPIEYPGYIRNIVPHCTTTKKKRKRKTPNGLKDTKSLAQSRCKVSRGKLHMLAAVSAITFVMINLAVSV